MNNEKHARLQLCERCKKHGHIVLPDGSQTVEFGYRKTGQLIIGELLSAGQIDAHEASSLAYELESSPIPEEVPIDILLIATVMAMLEAEGPGRGNFDRDDDQPFVPPGATHPGTRTHH